MGLELVYSKEELKRKFKVITISKPEDLNKLRNIKMNTTLIVLFTDSINMYSTYNFDPIKADDVDVIIYGFNKTISNLRIYKPEDKFVGLFSKVRNLYVKNLDFKNIRTFGEEVTGSIAGEIGENLTLNNVHSIAHVNGDAICGGICGNARDIIITNSNINSYVHGRGMLGGVSGMADTFENNNSYITTLLNDEYRQILNETSTNQDVGYLSERENGRILRDLRTLL